MRHTDWRFDVRLKFPLQAALFAALLVGAGCTAPDTGDVMAMQTSPSSPRNLLCLARGTDDSCVRKLCTSTSGPTSTDCASYGQACTAANLHWVGNGQDGVCSKP